MPANQGDRTLDRAQSTELESMIDRSDVRTVLNTIAQICSEKADHIREAWQDQSTAAAWDRAAGKVEQAAARVTV